jgi:flavin reductase (DIM6/NTAB) family NADH-FMN oxidoreductase RutF
MNDIKKFKNCMSKFATGVTIVTSQVENQFIGITINTFSSLSLNPMLVLFNLKKNSFCYNDILKSGKFAVNILSDNQQELSELFTRKISREEWKTLYLANKTLPCFQDSLAYIECDIHKIFDGGDHSIIVGSVINIEEFNNNPLIYYNRNYHKL